MHSKPAEITSLIFKSFKTSAATRFGALAVVALTAAVVGPSGLAVGPSQSHTNTPALATGGAMEARVVLASIPISYDIVQSAEGLIQDHSSYPVRVVGELRFPVGAIDVPWADTVGTPERATEAYSAAVLNRGSNVSTPIREGGSPQLVPSSYGDTGAVTGAVVPLADFRSVILFDRLGSGLSGDAEEMLDRLAASLRGGDDRIQLRAFGGSAVDRTHAARRLALRRALSVRNYLMDQGIDQQRITVRAMGGATDGGPSDRVDVVYPAANS